MSTESTTQTREVLAGAYRGGIKECRSHLVHMEPYMTGTRAVRVHCKTVQVEHLVDELGCDIKARPTCPRCANAWDRLQKAQA